MEQAVESHPLEIVARGMVVAVSNAAADALPGYSGKQKKCAPGKTHPWHVAERFEHVRDSSSTVQKAVMVHSKMIDWIYCF